MGILNSESCGGLKFQRAKVHWPVYGIAFLGLLINIVYYGFVWFMESGSLAEHFTENLPENILITSLIIIFPLVALLAHRVVAGYRLSEYSRRLELEMKNRNRQFVDLMNFNENIMNSVNDLVFVIGSDGRFQFIGGNCSNMLGREPGSLVGRQFIELVATGSIATAVSNFESILRGAQVPPYELEVKSGKGETRFIEVSCTSYPGNEMASAQVCVARDVTERKKLEQHVVKRNLELAALNAVATAVGHSLELDEVLSSAIDQVAGLMKVKRVCVYLYEQENDELRLGLQKGVEPGENGKAIRVPMGEGALGIAARQGSPILLNRDDDPEEIARACCGNDIEAIAAIPMRSRGSLVGVLGLASDEMNHFSRADIGLMKVVSNQIAMAIENALLYQESKDSAKALEKRNNELALATDELSHLIAAAEQKRSFAIRSRNPNLVKCWETKSCTQVECPSFKSENLRCWQVAGTHCGGEVQGVFAQKFGQCEKCEVYKMARPDLLTELGEAFNNMMAMLEQKVEEQQQLQAQLIQSTKLAAIGELAANIAHEINNPLTGILGHASLMSSETDERDPRSQNLQIIKTETIRARDIVRNLLDFSRQDDLRKVRASAREVVDDTLLLLRRQAELANVAVVRDYAEEVPQIYIDTNQMKQIFVNILNNAIYAMPDGGTLTISIRSDKPDSGRPWVVVAFRDTGAGIPAEELGRVFDPFYTSKEAGEGTGLGLSISRRMVEDHGGNIEVESEVGVGSTFRVKLPTGNIATDLRHVA